MAATQPSALSTFTLFAEQSLVMAKENLLRRGHAGVNSPTGLAKIGPSSRLDDAATLVAARVKLAPFASIGDAFATEISGPPSAMARGTESRGQFEILALPPLPAFSPGPGAVTVAPEGTRILLPGQYDALSVGRGGTVILAGGEYDFRTLALRRDASVLVAAPVTVKVRDTFSMATGTAIAPMSGSGLGPDDISVVFGSSRALRLGNEAILTASFFAPEAAVKVGKGAYLTGRIVGRTITLQSGVISTLPICGDELVEVGEECDGANDAICPGACSADCTCNVARPSAALHLEKTVGGLDADELPGLTVKPGGLLTFGFAVSNTGNAILENITIVDDRLGAVGTIAVLAPGATEMLSAVSTAPKQGTLLTAATAIGFPAGGGAGVSSTDLASITVQAQSTAQAPKTVSGEAYGFFAQLVTPAGSIMVPKTPHVVLPAAGGVESQQVLSVGVPNLAATGTLTAETEGFIDSSGASAQSTATVQNVNLLNGLISADTVIAMASSMCGGTAATSTAEGSTFVGLVVSGIPINVTPAPNTTIPLPGVGTVILNEQIPGGDGVNNTELTVNMIHVILDSPALTGDIIVASAHSDAHCPPVTCLKTSVQTVLDPKKGRFPGNEGFDVTVRGDLGQSVQEAIDRAADVNGDGYIIIGVVKDGTGNLGGTIRESIVIDDVYALPFALTGCSVTLEDPTPTDGEPTARIAATASSPDLFVMDLHAAGSDVAGWLVEGDGRSFRNVNATGNGGVGILWTGQSGAIRNGKAEGNDGDGILVIGDGNTIDGADAMSNGGDGVRVVGNDNLLQKIDSGERNRGNGGDGIHVVGAGNRLVENDSFANGGDGLDVSGGTSAEPNVLEKNRAGEKSKGNQQYGILVGGDGNGVGTPIEINANTARSNGLNGFNITGTGHELKNNVSGGSSASEHNGACEYLVAPGNINAGGNRVNGTTLKPPGFSNPPC